MAAAWDEMVLVGRIARAHGNRGEVIVNSETDFPEERFRPGAALQIRRPAGIETLTIDAVRFHRGRPIIGFVGVTTMDAAEALAGTELRVELEALQSLPHGSFYRHDLVGCLVETVQGERVGEVVAVEGEGAVSRLVVRGRSAEVLIPLAESICVKVDTAARQIVVAPMEGLLDLNAAERQRF